MGNQTMRKVMGKVAAVALLLAMSFSMAACTNRPLSLLDTDPLDGNTHQFEVWKDGKVVYAP